MNLHSQWVHMREASSMQGPMMCSVISSWIAEAQVVARGFNYLYLVALSPCALEPWDASRGTREEERGWRGHRRKHGGGPGLQMVITSSAHNAPNSVIGPKRIAD